MPIYVLECKKCQAEYEILSSFKEKEKNVKKAKCPECNSRSKVERLGLCGFNFTNPEGTDRYSNSHDYRYHHTVNKPGGVRDQRAQAEQKSHVGPTPYNSIDDISCGKYFGEVK